LLVKHNLAGRVILLACFGLVPVFGLAQEIPPTDAEITTEVLEGRIQEVEATAETDESSRSVLELYRRSLGLIRQREAYEAKALQFVESREAAPKKAAKIRKQLEKLEASVGPEMPAGEANQSLQQLEQLLLREKANLSNLRASLVEFGSRMEAQSLRAQQVREGLEKARDRQSDIGATLSLPATPDQPQRQTQARLWAHQIETRTLVAEIEMLNQELLSQPMRVELLNVQRDLALLRWDRQKKYVELIGMLVGNRRVAEAESSLQETAEIERQTFGKHPLVQELAQSNTQLSVEISELAGEVDRINLDENKVTDQIKHFVSSYRLTRKKLEIAGLGQALGEALLLQRNSLPRAREFVSAEKYGRKLVVESSLRQIRNQQERTQLGDIDGYVAQITKHLSDSWQTWVYDELRELALKRRDLLDAAIAADDSLQQELSELDFARRELSKVVSDFNRLLDERLLWVRTGEPLSMEIVYEMRNGMSLFLAAGNWRDLGDAFYAPEEFPFVLLIGLLIFALLWTRRGALRASLKRTGRNVGQLRHDRLYYSIKALILTWILALPLPILVATLGLHLKESVDGLTLNPHMYDLEDWRGQFVPAIGSALYGVAFAVFNFVAFRLFCEPGGLAVAHFKWLKSSTELLRRETLRLMLVFLPSVFLIIALVTYYPGALAGGLSRLLICIVAFALVFFFARVLSPTQGAMCHFYKANPRNPLSWLRYFWYALGFVLPIVLAGLAATGYVYTATQLGARLTDTLWLIVAIVLIHQLVVRWVVLLERQLEFKDTLERHRAQRAAREALGGDQPGSIEPVEEPEIDFGALSDNTQKLINTAVIVVAALGMWAIWSDVFPAFRVLDDVSLWSYSSTVQGEAALVPVTLGNLLSGLLILVFGAITAMRLPAVMEILLFARFDITAGSRYAISKLTQYLIIATGIVWAASVLGGSWGEIQWLVAALGVGIGFGLQEIIANFISGLILLFERPIRIGDIVTVGETSGVVTKIRIRSTTIRNWDQQELLVPNKEFITGRLLNWTLSDPVARIVISVGIAYGSDVEKALKILLSCAEKHERVIEEPSPLVTFESFGDNALDLKLRCYIGSMDYRLLTLSEINQDINREMKAAGIVIAFPQRDVHLDTSQPLELVIHRQSEEPAQT